MIQALFSYDNGNLDLTQVSILSITKFMKIILDNYAVLLMMFPRLKRTISIVYTHYLKNDKGAGRGIELLPSNRGD